jgi:transcriptional regulator with XRE-family HTH domain
VVPTRIGTSLKAARARLGWSRETLAHHSGVSWSAIAQIESGRRKDVRLSSLTALADALGVSVDYLIGTGAVSPGPHLEHRVLIHGSDEELVAGTVPFMAEGMAQSQALLAVTTPAQTGVLRDALGDDSRHVEFADSGDWYRSPRAALDGYRAFVNQKREAGAAWIRVVGKADWAGRSDAEMGEWIRYESIVSLAFASSPATIICLYDTNELPESILAGSLRTHAQVVHGTDTTASSAYREPEDLLIAE